MPNLRRWNSFLANLVAFDPLRIFVRRMSSRRKNFQFRKFWFSVQFKYRRRFPNIFGVSLSYRFISKQIRANLKQIFRKFGVSYSVPYRHCYFFSNIFGSDLMFRSAILDIQQRREDGRYELNASSLFTYESVLLCS